MSEKQKSSETRYYAGGTAYEVLYQNKLLVTDIEGSDHVFIANSSGSVYRIRRSSGQPGAYKIYKGNIHSLHEFIELGFLTFPDNARAETLAPLATVGQPFAFSFVQFAQDGKSWLQYNQQGTTTIDIEIRKNYGDTAEMAKRRVEAHSSQGRIFESMEATMTTMQIREDYRNKMLRLIEQRKKK